MGDTLEQRNIDIVMQYFGRLQVSDGAGMAEFLAPQIDYWVYSTSPYAGHYDRARFLNVLPGFFEKQAAPIRFDFEEITAQDDRVCAFAKGRMPLKDGGNYNNVFHFMFKLRDGKIRQVKEVYAPMPVERAG